MLFNIYPTNLIASFQSCASIIIGTFSPEGTSRKMCECAFLNNHTTNPRKLDTISASIAARCICVHSSETNVHRIPSDLIACSACSQFRVRRGSDNIPSFGRPTDAHVYYICCIASCFSHRVSICTYYTYRLLHVRDVDDWNCGGC